MFDKNQTVKKFKEWEKRFSSKELNAEALRWIKRYIELERMGTTFGPITKWDLCVNSWTQGEIQYAVYYAPDVADWQRFRVAMKGQKTVDKIKMLRAYFVDRVFYCSTTEQMKIDGCRIDNYIGALRRGGQLNEKMEVVR
jgi:hypothetical protein